MTKETRTTQDERAIQEWLKNNTPTQCEPMATSENIEYTHGWGARKKKPKGDNK